MLGLAMRVEEQGTIVAKIALSFISIVDFGVIHWEILDVTCRLIAKCRHIAVCRYKSSLPRPRWGTALMNFEESK